MPKGSPSIAASGCAIELDLGNYEKAEQYFNRAHHMAPDYGFEEQSLERGLVYREDEKHVYLVAYVDHTQQFVTGTVRLKLCKGTCWHQRIAPSNPAVDPYFPINQAALKLVPERDRRAQRPEDIAPACDDARRLRAARAVAVDLRDLLQGFHHIGHVHHHRHAGDVRLRGDQVEIGGHGMLAIEHGLVHAYIDLLQGDPGFIKQHRPLDQITRIRQRRIVIQDGLPRVIDHMAQRTHGLRVSVSCFERAAVAQQRVNAGEIA